MNRLFTRVFLAFWLTLLLVAGLSALVTSRNFAEPRNSGPAQLAAQAQRELDAGGMVGLQRWVQDFNATNSRRRIEIAENRGPGDVPEWREPPQGRPPGDRPPPRPGGHGPPDATITDASGNRYQVRVEPPEPRRHFEGPFTGLERAALILLAVLVSASAAFWVARSIGRPLRSLQIVSQRLASGSLAARPDPGLLHRRDEIGALSRDFDNMAERLSSLLASRQHLLRELSHEMRAPLARLRVALDLMDLKGGAPDRHLLRVSQEADRLEKLANGVLTYARMEQESQLQRIEPIDLQQLAADAVVDICYELQLQPAAFALASSGDAMLEGDSALLRNAVENLLRNAATHGGTHPPVQLQIETAADRICLLVRDHGAGVNDSDLPRLFKPFSRLPPPARASAPPPPGNGLGLAIVAQVAKLHHGSVAAHNAAAGGLIIRLELPRRR